MSQLEIGEASQYTSHMSQTPPFDPNTTTQPDLTKIPENFEPDSKLVDLIVETLADDKAQDIVLIDLAGKTSLADVMIVASGRSHRHVSAIADHLLRALKNEGHGKCRVEGLPHCDWVLIDSGDAIIHIFRPEVRDFYKIEKLWGEAQSPDKSDKMVG